MSDAMGIGTGNAAEAEQLFKQDLLQLNAPHVLELGTLRWKTNVATHHQSWAPHASRYVMSDVGAGIDVDVVADAHSLEPFEDHEFDAYIAISVWEHLRQPWVCAAQAYRVLKPGGLLLVITHQTFPIHGYPHDYYRFSDLALSTMFADVGFDVVSFGYQYPCQIIPSPEVVVWNPVAPAFLNVGVYARKPKG